MEHEADTWTDEAIDKELGNLYYASGDPASYGGVERLHERAHEMGTCGPRTCAQVPHRAGGIQAAQAGSA